MYYYINTFYIYSIIGFIYEEILCILTKHRLLKNLLFELMKPIYGIGVLFILLISKIIFKKIKIKHKYKLPVFILSTFLLLTIFEYISGKLLHLMLGKTLWNYHKRHLHIGKYICLEVSIIWVIMSLAYIYLLKDKTDRLIKKIPEWFTNYLLIITITDILLSLII